MGLINRLLGDVSECFAIIWNSADNGDQQSAAIQIEFSDYSFDNVRRWFHFGRQLASRAASIFLASAWRHSKYSRCVQGGSTPVYRRVVRNIHQNQYIEDPAVGVSRKLPQIRISPSETGAFLVPGIRLAKIKSASAE
jgi:hypothetical protein